MIRTHRPHLLHNLYKRITKIRRLGEDNIDRRRFLLSFTDRHEMLVGVEGEERLTKSRTEGTNLRRAQFQTEAKLSWAKLSRARARLRRFRRIWQIKRTERAKAQLLDQRHIYAKLLKQARRRAWEKFVTEEGKENVRGVYHIRSSHVDSDVAKCSIR